MKIGIISDWHLGYNWDSDLEMDSFLQLEQAFIQLKEQDIDLILVGGDLFDKSEVNNEVFYQTIKLLDNIDIKNKIGLENSFKKLKLPMISIIGNHEYRGKDYKSTVELLEIMGFLKYIHLNEIVIDDVCIQGMSGIPEKYAIDVLNKWNPLPKENKYNILMIHQSIKEYLPQTDDEMIAPLSLSNLPKGFDLIVNGHLHWQSEKQLDEKTTFILPGSTLSTQLKKLESKKPKGFYVLDTNTKKLKFIEIKETRPIYYLDLEYKQEESTKITQDIIKNIEEIKQKKHKKTPLIRIRIKGSLKKGDLLRNIKINKIKKEYNDLYISFTNKIKEESLKESIKEIKELEKDKTEITDIIREIFTNELKNTNFSNSFDYNRLFEVLYNKDYKLAKEILFEK